MTVSDLSCKLRAKSKNRIERALFFQEDGFTRAFEERKDAMKITISFARGRLRLSGDSGSAGKRTFEFSGSMFKGWRKGTSVKWWRSHVCFGYRVAVPLPSGRSVNPTGWKKLRESEVMRLKMAGDSIYCEKVVNEKRGGGKIEDILRWIPVKGKQESASFVRTQSAFGCRKAGMAWTKQLKNVEIILCWRN
jgi:hypothetical protein